MTFDAGCCERQVVIGCVIAYNDERMLAGCLESIVKQVDRIVMVDGAFATFPLRNGKPYSTDATREIAWCYGAEWVECPDGQPWHDEMEKRTAYLVGEEGDWYFHVDTDERLVGQLPRTENGRGYALTINVNFKPAWRLRLFQHRGRMRYEGSHAAVWSEDRLLRLAEAVRIEPERCRLLHLSHLRPAWQQLARREHYARRTPLERAYREAHCV